MSMKLNTSRLVQPLSSLLILKILAATSLGVSVFVNNTGSKRQMSLSGPIKEASFLKV